MAELDPAAPGTSEAAAAPGTHGTTPGSVDNDWATAIAADELEESAAFRDVMLKGMGEVCS